MPPQRSPPHTSSTGADSEPVRCVLRSIAPSTAFLPCCMRARRQPGRGALAAMAVMLLHGGVLTVLLHAHPPDHSVDKSVRSTAVRLLPPRPSDSGRMRSAVPPSRSPPSVELPRATIQQALNDASAGEAPGPESQATPLTAQQGPQYTRTTPVPASAAPQVTAEQLRPSRAVLGGALANPATSDPRSQSPRPTFDEQLAMGADPTRCLRIERLADGSTRRTFGTLREAQATLSATTGLKTEPIKVCE